MGRIEEMEERWADPDEWRKLVDDERTEAAHAEWERHERVRRVILAALEEARTTAVAIAATTFGDERTVALVGTIEGIREVMTGEWLQSPKTMRAVRAPKSEGQ